MGGDYWAVQSSFVGLVSTALQTSYADAVSFTAAVGKMKKAMLYITYTTGAAETNNSIEVKVESGPTAASLFRAVAQSTSGGTITAVAAEYTFVGASAATAYKIAIPLDLADPFMKISFKESGVAVNAGSVVCHVVLSGS